eukprot:GEMP01085150.1.p1 GENE.GEMP01085150.1~~GEMP01085150.1.p1  ORF type:complete len:118 (+),score=5.16 GEMP01085150.1:332-685(+)
MAEDFFYCGKKQKLRKDIIISLSSRSFFSAKNLKSAQIYHYIYHYLRTVRGRVFFYQLRKIFLLPKKTTQIYLRAVFFFLLVGKRKNNLREDVIISLSPHIFFVRREPFYMCVVRIL